MDMTATVEVGSGQDGEYEFTCPRIRHTFYMIAMPYAGQMNSYAFLAHKPKAICEEDGFDPARTGAARASRVDGGQLVCSGRQAVAAGAVKGQAG